MSLILDGTNGVSDIDGTAATPAIRGTDTNTGIFFGSDIIGFSEGGAEVARFDASGNFGIGGSPAVKFNVIDATSSVVRANQTTNGTDVRMVANASGAFVGSYAGTSLFLVSNSTTQASIDTNGLLAFNSGYGSVAAAYGCRAWVNFNGTGTPAIRASGNVTSITDGGTGVFTVNFTNALPDVNYSVSLTGRYSTANTDGRYVLGIDNMNAGSCKVVCLNVSDTALLDPVIYCCAFFR